MAITDTSIGGDSPYADRARQGATVVPRCLFFINETESTTTIHAGQTINVTSRRGSQDKKPWKDLNLALQAEVKGLRELVDLYRERLTDSDWRYQELMEQFKTMPKALPAGPALPMEPDEHPRPKRRWWSDFRRNVLR